jgi:hypothetical protein
MKSDLSASRQLFSKREIEKRKSARSRFTLARVASLGIVQALVVAPLPEDEAPDADRGDHCDDDGENHPDDDDRC